MRRHVEPIWQRHGQMNQPPGQDAPIMDDMPPTSSSSPSLPRHGRRTLEPWQAWTVASFVALIAVALAVYAAAASYESVSHLAATRGVPLPYLNPLGIDGGLLGVIVFSVALYWMGTPIRWLRLAARLFAAGTIAANIAAGWPDPAGVGLRIAAPALFVVIVEATYSLLVHRHDETADRIPRARWLLAPWSTLRMWRRMKLWEIRSYPQALDMELSRRQAIMKLAALYEGGWREAAPDDLVWMLTEGVRMDEALARVAELTTPNATPAATPAAMPEPRQRTRQPAAKDRAKANAKARQLLIDNPGMLLADVAKQSGVSERTASRIKSSLPTPLRVARG